jgi:hypothetical protein
MELNKEIRDILIEFAMIVQEEKYTNSQVLIRSTYDTFRIQNIVKNLSLSDVSQQRELLIAFDTMREFDIKHENIEESVEYFLKHKESYL